MWAQDDFHPASAMKMLYRLPACMKRLRRQAFVSNTRDFLSQRAYCLIIEYFCNDLGLSSAVPLAFFSYIWFRVFCCFVFVTITNFVVLIYFWRSLYRHLVREGFVGNINDNYFSMCSFNLKSYCAVINSPIPSIHWENWDFL